MSIFCSFSNFENFAALTHKLNSTIVTVTVKIVIKDGSLILVWLILGIFIILHGKNNSQNKTFDFHSLQMKNHKKEEKQEENALFAILPKQHFTSTI